MFGESITKVTINILAGIIVVAVLVKWFLGDLNGGVQFAAAVGPIFIALTTAYTYGASKKREFNKGNSPGITKDMSYAKRK